MEYYLGKTTLFEVSWEVCNKVGGIYTVVSSKASCAVGQFGENYCAIGPDTGSNAAFDETDEPCWEPLRVETQLRGLRCRFGRWNIAGRPKAVLVSFKDRYKPDDLLRELWDLYGVDSYGSPWDYVEPVLFSAACAEVIAAACRNPDVPLEGAAVAHFHEWMCGAGLLMLKKHAPEICTVFTTHATVLGRCLAGTGMDIYRKMETIDPFRAAAEHMITAKCAMERTAAREADCFTTVSRITADESVAFLGREPDIVTPNGLDMNAVPDFSLDRATPEAHRKVLFQAVNRLLRTELPETTKVVMISGRYEFHNKGIDAFLEAMGNVNELLAGSDDTVLALCLTMGAHDGVNADAVSGDPNKKSPYGLNWLCSHILPDQQNDPILTMCRRLQLDNRVENRVKLVLVPALLDGNDGFLNMTYEAVLSACDLGVFPSWYEPWGYTPQESAARAVPTVTTDLSGFGMWVEELHWKERKKSGITVLPRRNRLYNDVVYSLRAMLIDFLSVSETELARMRTSAREISLECSWEHFFHYYIQAYSKALDAASERVNISLVPRKMPLTRLAAANNSIAPTVHPFKVYATIPQQLARLYELAMNIWWCWHPECWRLFAELNPKVWATSSHNPIVTLEEAHSVLLDGALQDASYMDLYRGTLAALDNYMKAEPRNFAPLTPETPVAYFSTEYGLHECLPVYSGGLGVLSGDHLKSASDLGLPLVAVGLLYKNGYFKQQIDKDGRQKALYPENDFSQLPLEKVTAVRGAGQMKISVALPGRSLTAKVWKAQVGRVPLYLLDADSPENGAEDAKVTARLYESDRDCRLRQEILLGVGGVRLLRELGLKPTAFHMNEGHSAFLVFERIRASMRDDKLEFHQAAELVRANTVFTTHTPVDAGNERFPNERILHYFGGLADDLGISKQELLQYGNFSEITSQTAFEMTVLALNFSCKANGVSALHGDVARHMWQQGWKGVPPDEVPIGHVTNGVHVPTYVGPEMRTLLDRHLGSGWQMEPPESPVWFKVAEIPDDELIKARQEQKNRLLNLLRDSLPAYLDKYGISHGQRKVFYDKLNSNPLVIGFARRFAPYKRALLLFSDAARLAKILSEHGREVIIVFSGKSHPADAHGIDILQQVVQNMLKPEFLGTIYFLEDYNLNVSRALVQGCDVWLNTPRAPYEACGTSGQKVSVNGGLNLSISDGWWCEGYDGSNGWTIGRVHGSLLSLRDMSDEKDAAALYHLLEDEVLPLYFGEDPALRPSSGWMTMVKNAMSTLVAPYNAIRMVAEYAHDYYQPVAARHQTLAENECAGARRLSDWKRAAPERFKCVKIDQIIIAGLTDNRIQSGQCLNMQVNVCPGDMKPEELRVELVVAEYDGETLRHAPAVVELEQSAVSDGMFSYTGVFKAQKDGSFAYGVRVFPVTEGLVPPYDAKLMLWG